MVFAVYVYAYLYDIVHSRFGENVVRKVNLLNIYFTNSNFLCTFAPEKAKELLWVSTRIMLER